MKIKEDTKQSVKSTFKFFIEFYKILIGTFLTLTVPKHCGSNSCTIMNNVNDTTLFHQIALYINGISFLLFIMMYGIEIKREKWCINKLDEDKSKSISNLDLEIENYGGLKKEMHSINKKYALITKVCILSQFVNICVSSVDVAYKWYGYRSFTPFSSYIIVILMKLYNSYNVSRESLLYERAYSTFLTDPKIYNTIDEDYKKKLREKNIEEKCVVEIVDNVDLNLNNNYNSVNMENNEVVNNNDIVDNNDIIVNFERNDVVEVVGDEVVEDEVVDDVVEVVDNIVDNVVEVVDNVVLNVDNK